MANTAEELRMKSEAYVKAIRISLGELRKVNDEIAAQMEQNNATAEQAQANIEQLYRENEELAVLKTDNETFISKVEGILTE
jgi:hypothetical protein